MAATKKAEEIRTKTTQVHMAIMDLHRAIIAACNKVPKSAIHGDAVAAVKWRDLAEKSFAKSNAILGRGISIDSNSLDKLHKTLTGLQSTLNELSA